MKRSTDRILTTHVGSLPRSQAVTDVLFARERNEVKDALAAATVIANAVAEVVRRQVAVGIDVVSDGEMSKISYATYVAERLAGFGGDTPREPGQDLVEFPGLLKKLADRGSTAKYRRPRCIGEIRVKNLVPLQEDLKNLQSASAAAAPTEAFMNAASPGVVALFQPNDFYSTQDEYLTALAEALRVEYEAIAQAGIILQIDAPDLAMGRHTMYRERSLEEFEVLAARHIEVLNHALRNVPAYRVRMHVCWGNYEGPHHHDVPMERLLPVVLKAKPQGLLFEAANPRHAHEWTVFKDLKIPDDKILIPGLLATTTNYIEHPLLVAERIERFAQIVGRERVMAGSDCGFGTFAGFGPVEPDIAYLKLQSLAQGAAIASRRLWRGGKMHAQAVRS
ncbi:MAG TPA: cobalamin-independent methionine synthase II family protein [Steroidobacteraceae bacterium]|jgi:5-methyltetrahydropteroyltriglutamate--homocysteine methyltransferase|nr:cobalamin-independent methionine synthase II family protein [Steroidobacteraceae bacterium]